MRRFASVWRFDERSLAVGDAHAVGSPNSSSRVASAVSAASIWRSSDAISFLRFFDGPTAAGLPLPDDGFGFGFRGAGGFRLRSSRTRTYSAQPPAYERSVPSSMAIVRVPT